jgi:DNA invertase Pin-like site-specific DNA recombinase
MRPNVAIFEVARVFTDEASGKDAKRPQLEMLMSFVRTGLSFTGEDSPMANLMLSVMGAFAEFERALIHERQREGIALAKQPLMCQLRQACEKCGLTLRPLF